MSQNARRPILFIILLAIAGGFQPLHGEQVQLILILGSPRQSVEIPDESGRTRGARFEADARIFEDGQARGSARLKQGNDDYEFSFRRASWVVDAGMVLRLTLEGRGVKTSGHREEEFDFVATVTPSASSTGGIIIYDIQDGFVYTKPSFAAEGTMELVTGPGFPEHRPGHRSGARSQPM